MKTTRWLAVTAALMAIVGASTARAAAPIVSVVVYKDRAQITRSQAVDCARKEAQFDGLPSNIDTRTLWASVKGGSVIGLTHREVASGPQPEARAIQAKVRKVDEQLVDSRAAMAAASAAAQKLRSFRRHMKMIWGLQAAGAKPAVRSWDSALDLLRRQAQGLSAKRQKAAARQRALGRTRQELMQQLRNIERKRRRTTLRVSAMLKCTGRQAVLLSYTIPGATWNMHYQFRADPARARITLVAQALIQQGTGEDWKDVALSVSTANLQRKNTPPKLRRMRIATHKPTDTRKVLTRRVEHRRHLGPKGKLASSREPEQAPTPAGKPDRGLAMKVSAASKVTIPSDGRKVVVLLRRTTQRGEFTLEAVPKLFPHVYHKVGLRNPFDFTMLPGRVEIYRGRSFLGNAQLKLRAPGEVFAFSLGVDNQLQIKRYVKKEKMKGPGTFGTKKLLRHRYVIQLGNWTRKARKIRVLENIPVSQVRKIKVELSKDSTAPTSWNKKDGILAWEVKVPRRGKRKLTLDYTVTLPSSYIVTGYQRE